MQKPVAAPPTVSILNPIKPIRAQWKSPEGKYSLVAECYHEPTKMYAAHARFSHLSLCLKESTFFDAPDGKPSMLFAYNVGDIVVVQPMRPRDPHPITQTSPPKKEHKGDKKQFELVRWKVMPTCLDVSSEVTSTQLELLVGFGTGDIALKGFGTQQPYSLVVNKDGCLNRAKVTALKWLPKSESLFMAAFSNGYLMILHADRQDSPTFHNSIKTIAVGSVYQSTEKEMNPMAVWNICGGRDGVAIHAVSFSPNDNGKYLAVVSQDGFLRVYDFAAQRLLVAFRSYYGAFTCVCWSPDGKYLVTGGEDDLVTVWSFPEGRIMCRCEGHSSWISGVAFDSRLCAESSYRFASVALDCVLCMWDFSPENLRRPRKLSRPSSISSEISQLGGSVIPAATRAEVTYIQPVVKQKLHQEPITSVAYVNDLLMTVCGGGIVKFWARPSGTSSNPPTTTTTTASTVSSSSSPTSTPTTTLPSAASSTPLNGSILPSPKSK